jgi:hypothetical protein
MHVPEKLSRNLYISILSEYAEDISPYATFHVQGQGQAQQMPSSPGHMQTFVYHDHRLAAMETMQLKSVSNSTSEHENFVPSSEINTHH